MMRCLLNLSIPALIGLAACVSVYAEGTNAAPDFQQVYSLLRSNLAGMSETQLNSAAVKGLLNELHGRASLVGGPEGRTGLQSGPDLIKSKMIEKEVAYLLVRQVGKALPDELDTAYDRLASSNKIAGVALDLRFAHGDDFAAAVSTADLFVTKKMPLLKWDDTIGESHPAKKPIAGPLMVLVNGKTSGAAEALAAALREADAGLILGTPTAGMAMTDREFPLKNGERLRVAANPVKLGNGVAISSVAPDITVPVSLADERTYLKNPYAKLAQQENVPVMNTNDFLSFVDHTSEADLVREKMKAGDSAGVLAPPPAASQSLSKPAPVIQDPVLARALDLIKGLAIVHESHL